MSAFKNIRIFPYHGDRAALISWTVDTGVTGDVYVAYSEHGTAPWTVRNPGEPVDASVGIYYDSDLYIDRAATVGYYRLLVENTETGAEHRSEPVGIFTDIARKEYGILAKIIRGEQQMMRARNGYPVWYCIPKAEGPLDPAFDPDTLELNRPGCQTPAEQDGFGLPYQGGFYPPLLTWVAPIQLQRQKLKDAESGSGSREEDTALFRMLPFPNPVRGHMLVEPTSDRRYLIADVESFLLRGILPAIYEAKVEFLGQGDARYRLKVPELDMKVYRKMEYWT